MDLGRPAAENVFKALKKADPAITTSLYLSGWCGLRNIFSNEGTQAGTFTATHSDAEMVSDSVDKYHVFNAKGEELHAAVDDISYPYDIGSCPSSASEFGGDEAAVNRLISDIREGEASDASIVYLYNCDRTGHLRGFGSHVRPYLEAARDAVDDKLARIVDAVEKREEASDEEWLVVVVTDHGGTDRSSMGCLNTKFDALAEKGYGQELCEGVHGLRGVKQHRTTFLLTRVPPHVDPGGELIEDDGAGTPVCNADVYFT
eukprot:CAMPEP_0182478458 /NCGR_PEP_ID=MMETSP1319-20130603/32528_1 /TAXON_ID=172717 /ORGANISM="Bolidomonas pacifica, Strain RCC208" /LENGTH=259 /DNA_ID=CAMNT_0024679799 /DNA_START=345 /DNA_END=1120 /DNA_ORIENTATION=-